MRFGSVCSGIEAASVAWNPLGWHAAWFSEIEPYPCSALAHHYPDIANLGDMTTIGAKIAQRDIEAPDVFCGGTPCQAFSIAGVRKSLDDARGNLSLEFCRIANAIDDIRQSDGQQPCIVFWENVPGVLSTSDNAFGCFLAGIVGEEEPIVAPRAKWSNAGVVIGPKRTAIWRVLDAQYFGLAQRRKRVYVVASARDDIDIGQVLFEFEGVQRNTSPSISARKTNSDNTQTSVNRNSRAIGLQEVSPTLRAEQKQSLMSGGGQINSPLAIQFSANIAPTMSASGPPYSRTGMPNQELDAYVVTQNEDATTMAFKVRGQGSYTGAHGGRIVDANVHGGAGMLTYEEKTFTLATSQDQFIAYTMREDATNNTFNVSETEVALTLQSVQPTINSHHAQMLIQETAQLTANMRVRRLTPRECERLQGFPDDYTLVPHRGSLASDAPRYKALGNSWPVPVVRWIGERIQNSLILSNACK
jgi:DNA (cytosine-5)-methyltransferase 1